MTKTIIDQAVRDELLIPFQSFIVQAPAGSGKTELLTQRILALLAVVDKPENILAITFTRKAAAEMKNRVVASLRMAQLAEPETEYEKRRWLLACKVLARDKLNGWHLLDNPSRLNITTIDSLSASLSAALPLLSQTGALPRITENATQYYQQAADNLLNSISDGDTTAENIKILLRHKDNNLGQVSELIAQMLAKRLQWFAQLKSHARKFDENQLMSSLKIIITEKIQETYSAFPNSIISALPELLDQASQVLAKSDKSKKIYLQQLKEIEAIKKPEFEDLVIWKAIAELFLKANNKAEILSAFNVANGFPTEKDGVDEIQKQQFKTNKKLVTAIAAEIANSSELCELLLQIKLLPDDIESSIAQQSLQSAVALLPIAVAHLKLVFSRYNVIDFSELSLASLEALGHPEMPTDLALALDYRLEHILIDEFQDTSTPQIELIKLLTDSWEPDSARTLFLVGDPMQSIYRFRDANVSLFMQISEKGLGDISLNFRQLKVNFRSTGTIVNWVNEQFSRIMPIKDNTTYSAVSYASSVAFNQHIEGSLVECYCSIDSDDNNLQTEKIIEIINAHLKNNSDRRLENKKNKTLAILARSRNSFSEIIQLLNENNISFQAVEIDRLSEKMIVKDLTNLAFALTDQYDELSWSACMRSPWFGLLLEDIRIVMVDTDTSLSIPQRISAALPNMSVDSIIRCEKILPILNAAIQFKARKPFKKWLFGCFKALGGLSQLDFESDFDDLMVCLDKLNEVNDAGEINDRQVILDAIEKLYAAQNPHADEQVQVMTIHKSKGLEFDSVILPRLDSGKRSGDQALLNWTEVLDSHGGTHNLLAISKEVGKENDSVYQYIHFLDGEKSKYEDQRVLYVAATRAKQKLYLFGNVLTDPKAEVDNKSAYKSAYKISNSSSFLSMLWSGVEAAFIPLSDLNRTQYHSESVVQSLIENSDSIYSSRLNKRVNLDCVDLIPDDLKRQQDDLITPSEDEQLTQLNKNFNERQVMDDIVELASVVGTVLHRQLQWVSERYDDRFLLADNWRGLTKAQLLAAHRFKSQDELEQATDKVMSGLTNTLNDSFGRIILSANQQADSELVLHKKLEDGSFLTRIIDRAFIYENKRWIVDYKSSQPEKGESLNDFLSREKQQYLSQLSDYFKMFVKLEKRQIIAGLYFPLISHFEKVLEN